MFMYKTIFKGVYRMVPKPVRSWLYHHVGLKTPLLRVLQKMEDSYRDDLRKKIISYYESGASEVTEEQKEVVQYLKKNKLAVFPYNFYNEALKTDVQVYRDSDGLPYTFHNGKKLYFKRSWTDAYVKSYYISLLSEQHDLSPHRYLSTDFNVNEGDIVADVGCAEANFSLEVIEKAHVIYLFEVEEEWLEALNKTFAPWKEKVHIINKFVSNQNNDQFITLDEAIPRGKLDFIKIDAEGAENDILNGSEKVIATSDNLKIAVCTYHKQGDEDEFTRFFKERKFKTSTPHGYMIFIFDKVTMAAPYLRRGLIRAVKM
jgi:hypothetical protein